MKTKTRERMTIVRSMITIFLKTIKPRFSNKLKIVNAIMLTLGDTIFKK